MPSKIQIKSTRRQPKALFLLVFLLLLSLVIPPLLSRAAAPTLQDPAELESFLDGAIEVQIQLSHLPGITVAVVKDGTLFFSKGTVLPIWKSAFRSARPAPFFAHGDLHSNPLIL